MVVEHQTDNKVEIEEENISDQKPLYKGKPHVGVFN